jgi:hypothetical protein
VLGKKSAYRVVLLVFDWEDEEEEEEERCDVAV